MMILEDVVYGITDKWFYYFVHSLYINEGRLNSVS